MSIQPEPTLTETGNPMPDIPRLRKAVEWVEEQATLPRAQREWYQELVKAEGADHGRECDTVYCVAGKIAEDDGFDWRSSAMGYAEKALGLTHDEGFWLFDANNTAVDVRRIAESIAARVGERL